MNCFRCRENIDSILVNGIETERILYHCGNEAYYMHMGCIRNHHIEGRYDLNSPDPAECYVCQGQNPFHSKEDVKLVFENILLLDRLRIWDRLHWL